MMKNTIPTRTIKVPLNLEKDQRDVLIATIEESKKLFSFAALLCCEHRTTSYMTLHKNYYDKAKEMCPTLPTAYVQAIAKEACSNVKSFNTNNKKQKWNYNGIKKSSTLSLNKLTLSIRGNLVTISTLEKRIKFLVTVPEWFVKRYNITVSDVQAGTVTLRRRKLTLNLIYKVEPKQNTNKRSTIIGLDRGLYNLVSSSDGFLFKAASVIAIKRRYQHNRSKLQQKGTLSAKRKLQKLSGKEKRFMLDVNHKLTKMFASNPNVDTYVLENLLGIRKQRKGKKLNSWLSNWSFFQFQTLLEYKCQYENINVVFVDPRYTSQKCNSCGKIEKTNRNKGTYKCSCGYTEHSDINAAKNIRDNYVLSQKEKQGLFNAPNVMDENSVDNLLS